MAKKGTSTSTSTDDRGWSEIKAKPHWPLREGAVITGLFRGIKRMPPSKFGAWDCAVIEVSDTTPCVEGIGDDAVDVDAAKGTEVTVPLKAALSRALADVDDGDTVRITVTGRDATKDNDPWTFKVQVRK